MNKDALMGNNSLEEYLEQTDRMKDKIQPIIDTQERISKLVEATHPPLPKMELVSPAITALEGMQQSSIFRDIGEIALASHIPNFAFTNPILEQMHLCSAAVVRGMQSTTNVLAQYLQENQELIRSISTSVQAIADGYNKAIIAAVQSPVFDWISNLDLFPIQSILSDLQIIGEVSADYDELEETYLKTMMECKWFPYAAWAADLNLFAEISEIMATSRGASKRREQRIDRAVLSYYDKDEIRYIKKSWRESDLEPHIKRILRQAIDAHLRGEYALTITSLATLWEGLIYVKANNSTMQDRHKQPMSETKKELQSLTTANDYSEIFSDYFDNFIVSQCTKVGDIIEGVPNRHGAAHSWYQKYPNKKASLNAILLTDFIIKLEPIDHK